MMEQIKFKEQQRFRGIEIFALIAFFAIGITYRFIEQNFINMPEHITMTAPVFLLFLGILLIALVYFLSIRLTTRINEKGIRFQYSPWHYEKRKIKWHEIASWEIIDLPLEAEYSGWAIQFAEHNSYSVHGKSGLKLELTNGETIFIGSRKLTKLKKLMNQMKG